MCAKLQTQKTFGSYSPQSKTRYCSWIWRNITSCDTLAYRRCSSTRQHAYQPFNFFASARVVRTVFVSALDTRAPAGAAPTDSVPGRRHSAADWTTSVFNMHVKSKAAFCDVDCPHVKYTVPSSCWQSVKRLFRLLWQSEVWYVIGEICARTQSSGVDFCVRLFWCRCRCRRRCRRTPFCCCCRRRCGFLTALGASVCQTAIVIIRIYCKSTACCHPVTLTVIARCKLMCAVVTLAALIEIVCLLLHCTTFVLISSSMRKIG